MATISTPNLDLAYDSKIVWEIFKHAKNSTLEYGYIRNRAIKQNPKMSNDRQNAALNYLIEKGVIDKVAYGRYRFRKPVGQQPDGTVSRPSHTVVASAPVTVEQAATIVPRFPGATTDLVYSALREALPKALTTKDVYVALGIEHDDAAGKNDAARKNASASLHGLEKMGWIETDRSRGPRQYRYTALIVNKHGRPPTGLRHAAAPVPTIAPQPPIVDNGQAQAPPVVPGLEVPSTLAEVRQPTQPAPQQAPTGKRVFTFEEVLRYGELQREYAQLLQRMNEVAAELKSYEK